jgi:hypothetical protein
MTISEPNPEIRPIGEEPAEFVESPDDDPDTADNDEDVDPTARPSGSPPATG